MTRWVCCVLLAAGAALQAQTPDEMHRMFKANEVFALRDVVVRGSASAFYRGAVEASANEIEAAKKTLHAVIRDAPHSDEAYDAHDLLGNLYSRNGMYREAYRQVAAEGRERPAAPDVKNALPLYKLLNDAPRQRVAKRQPSRVRMRVEHGSYSVPLTINGKTAEYSFDTGAGISVMGQADATLFGLEAVRVPGTMTEASGTDVQGLKVAIAKDLVIGNLHVKNVPFVVIADAGEPFSEIPASGRGLIGLPLLAAMQTMRWQPDTGLLEFGFAGEKLDLASANMLFHNSAPVVQATVEDKTLDFTLDTGAVDTDLNPPFARALPELVKSGKPETHEITGMGGSNTYDSVLLPSVTFRIAGDSLTLTPTHVFVSHGLGNWAAGNLGRDLLNQAQRITLDFRAMRMRLE